MIAKDDTLIKDAATTIYELSEDERIQQQCEARMLYMYEQRKNRRQMRELKKELKETQDQLTQQTEQIEKQNKLIKKKDAENAKLSDENARLKAIIDAAGLKADI